MSYCRYGSDSDVYVYHSITGNYHCYYRKPGHTPELEKFKTRDEVLDFLIALEAKGLRVPERAFDRLVKEIENVRLQLSRNKGSAAAGSGS